MRRRSVGFELGQRALCFSQKQTCDRVHAMRVGCDRGKSLTWMQGPEGTAKLTKFAVVRTPRSVYAAIPGRNKYRPSQHTPISNFTLAGDWTAQKFLGSMEGATLAGKLAAEVICDKAAGRALQDYQTRAIRPEIVERAGAMEPKRPLGVQADVDNAIGWGAGAVLNKKLKDAMLEQDPAQGVEGGEYVTRAMKAAETANA